MLITTTIKNKFNSIHFNWFGTTVANYHMGKVERFSSERTTESKVEYSHMTMLYFANDIQVCLIQKIYNLQLFLFLELRSYNLYPEFESMSHYIKANPKSKYDTPRIYIYNIYILLYLKPSADQFLPFGRR